MTFNRLHKNILFFISLLLFGSLFFYFNLSKKHKTIIKTKIAHLFYLVDPNWTITRAVNHIQITSPTFIIDNIYKSMEGPNASNYLTLSNTNNDFLWVTGMQVMVMDKNGDRTISNDYMCHTNINYPVIDHYGRWNLKSPFTVDYARLISLSHGINAMHFPEGFGFPYFSDEKFYLLTQTLNHNIKDSIFSVKHSIHFNIENKKGLKPLKPLLSFIMLPFDKTNIKPHLETKYKDEDITTCIPVDSKYHLYQMADGTPLSGHWKIFKGKSSYSYNITNMLAIKDSIQVHYMIPHLHPFAEKFSLIDATTNTSIYTCNVSNHKGKTGLTNTPTFSSKKGVTLYGNHKYILKLDVNNITDETQDMMASMFLYVYDSKMDKLIRQYEKAN